MGALSSELGFDAWESAALKVVRTSARYFDPCEGESEEERQAYCDFRHWFLTKDRQIIMDLPVQDDDFRVPFEIDESISFPFSSMDFRRKYPFDKEQFRLRKIYERAKDLAQTHCCLSNSDGKKNCKMRFESLIRRELRERIMRIHIGLLDYQKKEQSGQEIAEESKKDKAVEAEKMWKLHLAIEKCKKIWRENAYDEEVA
jgi:hypothetical protein